MDLDLHCRCGELRGALKAVSPSSGNNIVCMCDDCQAAARWLGGDNLVDQWGGTNVFQVAPSRIALEQGPLALFRLSPKGLFRWYAACCRTPIGNTMGPKVPFMGVHRAFIANGPNVDEALGPIRERVQGRFGRGELPLGSHPRASVGTIARTFSMLGWWWIRGEARPSPVFDDAGNPRVEATVLTREERQKLYP